MDAVHEGHGFYVVSQSIAMSRRFGMDQEGVVRCVLTHVGRSVAEGIQDVVREDGVRLAHCRIRGAWMSPQGRMARIPRQARDSVFEGEFEVNRGVAHPGSGASLFDPPQPLRPDQLDLSLADSRPGACHRHPIAVRESDIDIFNHVNAANYVRFVGNALSAQGLSPSIHRAELKYSGLGGRGP